MACRDDQRRSGMPETSSRAARAARLRGYFDLQLRFAGAIARVAAVPVGDAIGLYTNFHRRFGLGPIEAVPASAVWQSYIDGLLDCRSHEQRVDWTQAFYARSPEERLAANERPFGCFSCTPPSAQGVVRFHFANRDSDDGVGPLGSAKRDDRTRELAAMFAFIHAAYPAATTVRGLSWLYHVEAYRRLFPPEFGASRKLPEQRLRLNGTSSWGQFLDHHDAIKPALRDAFLRNLAHLDVDRPWRAFPLPALVAETPIERFYVHYGVAPAKGNASQLP
jgi:hypothetical protein